MKRKFSIDKIRANGAMSALLDIENSLKSSPTREMLDIKKNLKNDEIDKEVAKSFNVANSAQMSSVIQEKLLSGKTLSGLVVKEAKR